MKKIFARLTLLLILIVVIGACCEYTGIVIRIACFLVALFLALNACCYFDHAVRFREKWRTATTGKRRTPPGQSIIIGCIFSAAAAALMFYTFHH